MSIAPLEPGDELAPGYEAIEHLRRGRALDVYDVWSYERAARCVIKALRLDRANDEKARRRLLEEGRLLEELTHPHIVRAYETLTEPHPMIVMETLTGETVGHLAQKRGGTLTVEELAQLGLHLGSAIRYLHARDFLHLDLKPSNVIAEAGRAKLIDLSVGRPPGEAHAGIGTWCYLSPEQARGGVLGPAADVWGVGVVLFEAATGGRAFDEPSETGDDDEYSDESFTGSEDWTGTEGPYLESDSLEDESLEEGDYPQLQAIAPRVDERRSIGAGFADLVAACLEPDAERRPTVTELLDSLEALTGVPAHERRYARSARRAEQTA